jgi:hypothetical protein
MFIGKEKLLLDCKMGWKVRRDMTDGKRRETHTVFELE